MKKAVELKNGSGRTLSGQHSAWTWFLLAWWFGVAAVVGQTHTITNCTEAALRAAVAEGGTVNFACDGTITLSNTILIATSTVLDGSGHQVIVSGGNTVRVFHLVTNVSFTLFNLTVADGVSTNGGAVCNDGGVLTLRGVWFHGNTAPDYGGGALFNKGGTINATNTVFSANEALVTTLGWDGRGGALFNLGGTVSLKNCVFTNNVARGRITFSIGGGASGQGGAVYSSGSLLVESCAFTNNLAVGAAGGDEIPYGGGTSGGAANGGAIASSGTMTILRSTFAANSALGGAGGPATFAMSPAGSGGGYGGIASGGAVFNTGVLLAQNSAFLSNSARGGSGGAGGPGSVTYNPMLGYIGCPGGTGGRGGDGAGGALGNSGSANLVNMTVTFNTAGGGSGASGGSGGNTSVPKVPSWPGGDGGSGGAGGSAFGGFYDTSGNLRVTNCTVTFNSGSAGNGGPGGPGGWGAQVQGATGPNGASGSAGAGMGTALTALLNSIVAGNVSSNGSGIIADAGHNLSSDGSCAFTNLGSRNNIDPMLGRLADNGGPTPTMALLPGSPAIDAGDPAASPPTDQRGVARPLGTAADIGAFEYGFLAITAPPESQTVEAGTIAELWAGVASDPPFGTLWTFNDTQTLVGGSNGELQLTNCQFSDSGAYRLVLTNMVGAVTSSPAMLNVIPAVPRRPAAGVSVTGAAGDSCTVEYSDALGPGAVWLPLGTVVLTAQPEFCFDAATPLPQRRFYRGRQFGGSIPLPLLDLHFVPAISLSGNIGDKLRLDYINAIGPIDAWTNLATVTLTNTSQLYFDTPCIGQPPRLWRIVPVP